jgi:TetR/AcrR family transcriptional regulator, cholesterol catabolism regulator
VSRVISAKVKSTEIVKAKHEKIFHAVKELFSDKGYHGTSMRDISAKSGINLSYLYSYIKTKDDLLYLFYDQLFQKWSEVFKILTQESNTADDILADFKSFLKSGFNIVRELKSEMITMYSESRHLSSESLKAILHEENILTLQIEAIIKRGVKQGVFRVPDTYIAANIVQYMLLFHAMRSWNFEKDYSFDRFIETTIDFILKGIGVPDKE